MSSLVFRRLIAMTIDMAIINLPGCLLIPIAFISDEVGDFVNQTFWPCIYLYFALWHGITGGITPGKLLFGLRVLQQDGKPLGFYATILRTNYLFIIPVGIQLLQAFLHDLYGIIPDIGMPTIMWPILYVVSVVAGRGQYGYHDLWAGTSVGLHNSAPLLEESPRPIPYLVIVVATTLVLGLGIYWFPELNFDRLKISMYRQIAENATSLSQHSRKLDEAFKNITNSKKYTTGLVSYGSGAETYEFSKSVRTSIAPVVSCNKRSMRYTIEVKPRGLFSSDFQRLFIYNIIELQTAINGPYICIEVEFVRRLQFILLYFELRRIFFGICIPKSDSECRVEILEPDNLLSFAIGAKPAKLDSSHP